MSRRVTSAARRRRWLTAGTALSAIWLAACGPPPPATPTKPAVTVWATPDANGDTPVPVDVVFAYERDALAVLQALQADAWFADRPRLLASLHGRAEAVSREILPGQQVEILRLPERYAASVGIVVFAGYRSPGAHRASAPGGTRILIELGRDTLRLAHDEPPRGE